MLSETPFKARLNGPKPPQQKVRRVPFRLTAHLSFSLLFRILPKTAGYIGLTHLTDRVRQAAILRTTRWVFNGHPPPS